MPFVRFWRLPVVRSLGGECPFRRNPDIRFRHRDGPKMTLFGHSVWDYRRCRSETYLDIPILICDLFPGLLRTGRKLVHVFQEQG